MATEPALLRHGFRAVKMKVGRNSEIEGSPLRAMVHRGVCEVSLAEDLARARAVRETIGPEVRLMVDVNGAWDVPTAVKMGRAMEPLVVDGTGHIELSERPGLGIELDPRVVAKYRVDK
ncbi:MAG TPA: enolase C-terminal domain-like protein [Candidatus Methylomirabilis sp.]